MSGIMRACPPGVASSGMCAGRRYRATRPERRLVFIPDDPLRLTLAQHSPDVSHEAHRTIPCGSRISCDHLTPLLNGVSRKPLPSKDMRHPPPGFERSYTHIRRAGGVPYLYISQRFTTIPRPLSTLPNTYTRYKALQALLRLGKSKHDQNVVLRFPHGSDRL